MCPLEEATCWLCPQEGTTWESNKDGETLTAKISYVSYIFTIYIFLSYFLNQILSSAS